MNSIRNILALVVILIGAWAEAYGQLGVRVEPLRRDYVVGENVMFKLTIVNHSDTPVSFTNLPGRCWLGIEVTYSGDRLPISPQSVPRFPAIKLTPGSSRSYSIGLKPHYVLNRQGTYRVVATLHMPDMKTSYRSNAGLFNLVSGADIRSFVVQARGQRLKMGVKLVNVSGQNILFGQVTNADTRQVVGASALGRYVNYMTPRMMLDRAQNLHVLCQSTPEYFTYAVMDTQGVCRTQKVMKRTGGPVDIVSTGNGVQCIGLAPYEKPKQTQQNIHSASERP